MAELRRDPVGGRWSIVATERAARPTDFRMPRRELKGGFCPFCVGNEEKTPPEVFAFREEGSAPDGPGWRVRVVPNKYPALGGSSELQGTGVGVYERLTGYGAHEVFIENPRHVMSLGELPAQAAAEVVLAYRERMLAFKRDERIEYALIFKNVGESAGASLEHTHSQMICTPVVPKRVGEEMDRCIEFYRDRGRCLLCEIVRQEIEEAERVVIDAEQFAVVAPYASRSPFEMWIVPKEHVTHFENTPPELLAAFAPVLHETLRRLDAALGDPPYNYVLHTTPFTMPEVAHYHWHLEVIPRVTHVAGFEWGTGFYINPVMPQQAAQCLREVVVEEMAPRAKPPVEAPPEPPERRRTTRRSRRA